MPRTIDIIMESMVDRRKLTKLEYVACRTNDILSKLTMDEALFLSQFNNLLDPDCGVYEMWQMFQGCANDRQAIETLNDVLPEK